jgi:hypothetical protein
LQFLLERKKGKKYFHSFSPLPVSPVSPPSYEQGLPLFSKSFSFSCLVCAKPSFWWFWTTACCQAKSVQYLLELEWTATPKQSCMITGRAEATCSPFGRDDIREEKMAKR